MAPMLIDHGFDVVGLDIGYYDDCTLVPDGRPIPALRADIREVGPADLKGFDAVVHLAALSNDPLGNLNPQWTASINRDASLRLAKNARQAGVPRFLFSSSCIMYGRSTLEMVDETAPLAPETLYASSKVEAERAIGALASDRFAPVFLRNGTVYGLSPRMRFDTVFNSLIGSAVTSGRVVVFSDGAPWRPVVHVEDVSRAFIEVLEAPLASVRGEAFNVGADELNHQIRELAEVIARATDCAVEYRAQPDADQRTYRTSFAKFRRTFPNFRFRWSIETAATAMRDSLKGIGLDLATFGDPRFTRVRWLQKLLGDRRLDDDLSWRVGAELLG
jgi:nucleoside-diphosphate-sugar epimerase